MVDSSSIPQSLDKLLLARRHVNRVRMEDNAYRYIYSNAVFHPLRILLVSLLQEHANGNVEFYRYQGQNFQIVDISVLKHKLEKELDVTSSNTQDNYVKKAIEIGLISKIGRGAGPNGRKAYAYLTAAQFEKISKLLDMFRNIDLAVEAQFEKPEEKRAGSDLLPEEVYYNIDADLRP